MKNPNVKQHKHIYTPWVLRILSPSYWAKTTNLIGAFVSQKMRSVVDVWKKIYFWNQDGPFQPNQGLKPAMDGPSDFQLFLFPTSGDPKTYILNLRSILYWMEMLDFS